MLLLKSISQFFAFSRRILPTISLGVLPWTYHAWSWRFAGVFFLLDFFRSFSQNSTLSSLEIFSLFLPRFLRFIPEISTRAALSIPAELFHGVCKSTSQHSFQGIFRYSSRVSRCIPSKKYLQFLPEFLYVVFLDWCFNSIFQVSCETSTKVIQESFSRLLWEFLAGLRPWFFPLYL